MSEPKLIPGTQLMDYIEQKYGPIPKWQKVLDTLHVKLICLWIKFKCLFKKGE